MQPYDSNSGVRAAVDRFANKIKNNLKGELADLKKLGIKFTVITDEGSKAKRRTVDLTLR